MAINNVFEPKLLSVSCNNLVMQGKANIFGGALIEMIGIAKNW